MEDRDTYDRRFHERVMDYYDTVAEEVLVDVCLYDMIEEYKSFQKNLSFPCFSKLMEAVKCTNE